MKIEFILYLWRQYHINDIMYFPLINFPILFKNVQITVLHCTLAHTGPRPLVRSKSTVKFDLNLSFVITPGTIILCHCLFKPYTYSILIHRGKIIAVSLKSVGLSSFFKRRGNLIFKIWS